VTVALEHLTNLLHLLSYLLTVPAHKPKYQVVPTESPDDSTIAYKTEKRESSDCRSVAGVPVQRGGWSAALDALS